MLGLPAVFALNFNWYPTPLGNFKSLNTHSPFTSVRFRDIPEINSTDWVDSPTSD